MAVSPARAAAFEILLRVERDGAYADELLASHRLTRLSSVDHGLLTELVMGVLRWRSLLDEHVAAASTQKLDRLDDEVLIALRIGAYQLQFLSRVPARAAIFESVELVKAAHKRSAGAFVNAVLRKMAAGSGEAGGSDAAGSDAVGADRSVGGGSRLNAALANIAKSGGAVTLARNSAHPEWLIARWLERFGLEKTRRICAYDQRAPSTSIRIYDDRCLEELGREGIELGAGRLLSDARIVLSGDVTRTSAYREGRIAIQDEGSQLVGLLVGRGEKILDCCAAPGGKTRVLARRNSGATIVAAELHLRRAQLVRERVSLRNVRVVAADARQLPFSCAFDRILADVPCSGTGTLARNPEIRWRLRAEDLGELQSRQIAILRSALAQLAVGGRAVYSTCSMEREENEAVVEAALPGAPEFSVVDCRGELEQLKHSDELSYAGFESLLDGPYLRTIPGVHPCDGFFAAVIARKTQG